jgi:3-hydroxybutyrate dehydrogenase
MTKYAAVGFLECLRYEMEGFGVKVCMIEPGNFLAGTSLFNDKEPI